MNNIKFLKSYGITLFKKLPNEIIRNNNKSDEEQTIKRIIDMNSMTHLEKCLKKALILSPIPFSIFFYMTYKNINNINIAFMIFMFFVTVFCSLIIVLLFSKSTTNYSGNKIEDLYSIFYNEKDYYINLISPFTRVAICNMTLFYLENKTENSDSYFKKLVELQNNLKNGISVSDDILTNKNLDVNNFNKEYLFYKKCLYNNK